jgi:hypothetical protein
MLCEIVATICGTRAPVIMELLLVVAVALPPVPHVHCFGASGQDVVGYDAKGCAVVGLDWRGRLRVSKFVG